ncbi:MAG TPA: class I SAM-dependent methyltransferase [Bryobacteraceae bacterium]|nr:class I SAM-dependent methyltransferase [Bryobacteraceae bacterium]
MSSLLLLCLLAAPQPSIDQILERHMQALGGQDAIARIRTQVRKGRFEFRAGGRSFPVETFVKAPDKAQFVLTEPGVFVFEQAVNGAKGWTLEPDYRRDLTPAGVAEINYLVNFSVPLDLRRFFPEMKVTGEEGGAWTVECKPASGDAVVAHFDKSTGLLTRIGDNYFEDYRTVDGVRLPFLIRAVQGRAAQVLTISEVRNNVPIEEARFDPEVAATAFKKKMDDIVQPALKKSLDGIDSTPEARAVLAGMYNFAPEDGRILYDFIVSHGYKRLLEIGTARGNSALWMGLALRKTGGKLITLEMNAEVARIATENFKRAGLADIVECRVNDAFKEIPTLAGDFDSVFMDTGARLHKRFLELVYPRVPAGGAISSHNANDMKLAMPDFLEAITENPDLETAVRETAGGGFTFSVRNR